MVLFSILIQGNTGKFVKLVMDEMVYLGPIDLSQYFVKETLMTEFEVPPNVAAIKVSKEHAKAKKRNSVILFLLLKKVDLIFGRRILSSLLTVYLPCILICMVSFSTNYFKAFFFEAIVTVNLTALLVLTTMFISVTESLPKTAYIKMVDIWLLFNLFIPFAEVKTGIFLYLTLHLHRSW